MALYSPIDYNPAAVSPYTGGSFDPTYQPSAIAQTMANNPGAFPIGPVLDGSKSPTDTTTIHDPLGVKATIDATTNFLVGPFLGPLGSGVKGIADSPVVQTIGFFASPTRIITVAVGLIILFGGITLLRTTEVPGQIAGALKKTIA